MSSIVSHIVSQACQRSEIRLVSANFLESTHSHETASAVGRGEGRLLSLDQYRGYTVMGMILVNFVGSYTAIREQLPILKHHNTYCSYADTIMPQFFFAVGYSLRMSMLRRQAKTGSQSAWRHAVTRVGWLLLVAFVVYGWTIPYQTWEQLQEPGQGWLAFTSFHKQYFQTLTHIAVTTLWLLPTILAPHAWRWGMLLFTSLLFGLLSWNGYYDWVWQKGGIDGGLLGFMSWSVPTLLGTFAYDWMQMARPIRKMLVLGLSVTLFGFGLSLLNLITAPNVMPGSMGEWMQSLPIPFTPPELPTNLWTMSQKATTLSYTYFSGGLSLLLFAVFVWCCDGRGWQLGIWRTLGGNALAAYILHLMVIEAIQPIFPKKDSPLWVVFLGFGITLAVCWLLMRHLEKQKLILRL